MFKRVNSAIKRVWNGITGAKMSQGNLNYEAVFKGNTDRYVDPLIEQHINDVQIPLHRERVVFEDALASMFVWDFQFQGWAKYPKFYESDQLDAPEIMPEVRALLMELEFKKPAIIAGVYKQAHGWQTSIFTGSEEGLDYQIFSETQCKVQNFIRQGKKVLGWRVIFYPKLPINRVPYHLGSVRQVVVPNDPASLNIIYDTRGDAQASWGYGYARIEPIWDALTKLRMESDSDSFRKAIFPMGIMPPNWDEKTIDAFYEKAANLSRTTAFTYTAAVDAQGKLYENIPALTFMSPSDNVKQTGSGQFGGLSAEWTRLLAGTKHTMGYIVGGGAISSSQAAAGVDLTDDQRTDINEWNLCHQTYIKKFIMWLAESGAITEVPPTFTIKCHWQWEHDELLFEQQLIEERAIAMEDEERERGVGESRQDNRTNAVRTNAQHITRLVKMALRLNATPEQVKRIRQKKMDKEKAKELADQADTYDLFTLEEKTEFDAMTLKDKIGFLDGKMDAFQSGDMTDPNKIWSEKDTAGIDKRTTKGKQRVSVIRQLMDKQDTEMPSLRGTRKALQDSTTRIKERSAAYIEANKNIPQDPFEQGYSPTPVAGVGEDPADRVPMDQDVMDEGAAPSPEIAAQGGVVESNIWLPVNSKSGNVQGVYYDPGDDNTMPTAYVAFKGGSVYSYQDGNIRDPKRSVEKIMQTGGEGVWEEYRAKKGERASHKPGKHPKGFAKTGGGLHPYAGDAHMMKGYTKLGSGPSKNPKLPGKGAKADHAKEREKAFAVAGGVAARADLKATAQDTAAKAKATQAAATKKKAQTTKTVGTLAGKAAVGLSGLYAEAWNNKAIDNRHPILLKYNSITRAAKMMHKAKTSIHKIMDAPKLNQLRFNAMHMGNSFSTSNPFKYEIDGYMSVEYQCPEAIKLLVGNSAPVWIGHAGDREEADFVGTYTINSFDEETGIEDATYDINWDLVDAWFARKRVKNWVKALREKGLLPDTSTEYTCTLKYNRKLSKFLQSNFNLLGVALVEHGNCSAGHCSLKET